MKKCTMAREKWLCYKQIQENHEGKSMKNYFLKFFWQFLALALGMRVLFWRYQLPARYLIPRPLHMLYGILLLIGVLVMAEIDMKKQEIPNSVLLYFLALGLLRLGLDWPNHLSYLSAFLLMGGLLLLIAIISGGNLGGGDIKLMALAGLCLGLRDVFIALALASILASIIGLVLLLTKKIRRDTPIPFGPFLGAGIYLAYLFGSHIWQWWM